MIVTCKCWERECIHYLGVKQDDERESTERHICKAFPNKIPTDIVIGKNLHTKPVDGDNGIQYEGPEKGE